jgi:acetolactate synthase-1/2/3 large subunit
LVHIGSSELHLMRSPMARLHVRGRIKTLFNHAMTLLRDTQTPPTPAPFLAKQVPYWVPELGTDDAVPLKPQRLMAELGRQCPYNTRFLADAGNSMAWAVHCLELHDQRLHRSLLRRDTRPTPERRVHTAGWLRVTTDFAPMGWAIGGAVGTALANPSCPVVCLTGDGSFLMNGQEITVAQSLNLTVLFVILNDAALGMVKHGQRLAGAEPIGFELPAVNYAQMAEAMGIPGQVIESAADLARLNWEELLRRKGPTLLDVRIDPEEVPPMNLRMRTLGAAL